jgi:hypothetical protein
LTEIIEVRELIGDICETSLSNVLILLFPLSITNSNPGGISRENGEKKIS